MAGSTELQWGGASDVGRVRSVNQDNFLARADLGLWAVADGMGGHRGGEVASEIACTSIGSAFSQHTVDGLVEAVETANAAVYRAGAGDPELTGMGTTIVALATVDDDEGGQVLAIANVGDSRAYRLSAGELDQLTNDHSLVADLVREGSLSPEEAAVHPRRNIVTRVLGVYDDVPVDVFTVLPQRGDRYILCSDGLFNEVPETTISSVLQRLADPRDAAEELVRLANEGGGRDNVTVVVVDVVDDSGRAVAASAGLADEPRTVGGRAIPPVAFADDPLEDPGADTRRGRRERKRGRSRGDDDLEAPRHRAPRGRRFTWRVGLFVILLLALAGGIAYTIQWYATSTYYVALEDDQVVIYKGRPGGVLWIQPEQVEVTDLTRDDLPEDRVARLEEGQEQGSLEEARALVANIEERIEEQRSTATTATPGSTTTTSRPPSTTTVPGQTTTTTTTPP